MLPKSSWILSLSLWTIYSEMSVVKCGRFTNELTFMHCLCSVPPAIRLQRINCMESFVAPRNPWRMHQSIQYCAYFAHKTRFGETMRQGENIVNYNPWQYSPVLNTNVACSYTRIRPYQYSIPNTYYVRPKGWIISKCILNMARVVPTAQYMNQVCCR